MLTNHISHHSFALEVLSVKYNVCIGMSVPAYFHAEVEADSPGELAAKVQALVESGGDDDPCEVMWDGVDDYRLVYVRDDKDQEVELIYVNDRLEVPTPSWTHVEAGVQ
jgi:hypothetical protein